MQPEVDYSLADNTLPQTLLKRYPAWAVPKPNKGSTSRPEIQNPEPGIKGLWGHDGYRHWCAGWRYISIYASLCISGLEGIIGSAVPNPEISFVLTLCSCCTCLRAVKVKLCELVRDDASRHWSQSWQRFLRLRLDFSLLCLVLSAMIPSMMPRC